MSTHIGENIKRLRRDKEVTQETLAEHLCISCQAISKWERGETQPDIALIIPIASYFGVTTDQLLGVDKEKDEQKIKDTLAEYDRLSNLGKAKEKCDMIRAAYKQFPNDFRIIYRHMEMLVYDPYQQEHNPTVPAGIVAHIDELSRICDRVLAECTIDDVRSLAMSTLVDIHTYRGDDKKAREIIERFPSYSWTKAEIYEEYLEIKSPEWWRWVHENLFARVDTLIVKFRNCALFSDDPPLEQALQFQKAVDFIKLVYEDGDYGFAHYHLCEVYIWIAERYIEAADYQKAAEYLDLGLAHSKQYDELPEIFIHTSFLVRGHVFDTKNVYSGYEGNDMKRELEFFETRDCYAKVREMDWFKAIVAKYKPYARADKKA